MFKRIFQNKAVRITGITVILLFAAIGFVLSVGFFGVKLHLFNDPGGVDYNDRFYQDMNSKYTMTTSDSLGTDVGRIANFYARLSVVNQFYPQNARLIHKAYLDHQNLDLAERMLAAVNLSMQDSAAYNDLLKQRSGLFPEAKNRYDFTNAFEWMNIEEWAAFKQAVLKDTTLIDSAGRVMDIEPRLIVSVLLGEQMRLFNSSREVYKSVMRPLKILSVESKFSLGVTGIKDFTAINAETYLKDSTSDFYPGRKYRNVLNFRTEDPTTERYNRLVDYRNHYYSYLYAAVILKQLKAQWAKKGYDISSRPEILATLFNVGYEWSKPRPNPQVGGSHIDINGKTYTFGALAFEFYYSGEMADVFPYELPVATKMRKV